MEHSPKFNTVKAYYESRRWSRQMVLNAAGKWITETEAAEILGETAQENNPQEEAAQGEPVNE